MCDQVLERFPAGGESFAGLLDVIEQVVRYQSTNDVVRLDLARLDLLGLAVEDPFELAHLLGRDFLSAERSRTNQPRFPGLAIDIVCARAVSTVDDLDGWTINLNSHKCNSKFKGATLTDNQRVRLPDHK